MRQPTSVTLRCGRWTFAALDPDYFINARLFELRWHTRGGELGFTARRAISQEELRSANFDIEEATWAELEQKILNAMAEDWP